jgi:uncharacterized protein
MERINFTDISDGHIFHSFKEYAIEFETEEMLNQIDQALGPYFRRIGTYVGILNFKNYLGKAQLGNKRVYVKSSKISEQDYEQMIKDIIEKMAQLPFNYNSPTNEYFEINEETSSNILYHMYLILKYLIFDAEPNLQSALESIIRNPTRRNIYEVKRTGIWNIDKVSSQVVSSIMCNPDLLVKLPSSCEINKTTLAKKLKRQSGETYFPLTADFMVLNNSLDTNENRFVKYFLTLSKEIIDKFRNLIQEKENLISRSELISKCRLMNEIIEYWLHHEMFIEVGDMDRLPFNSIILHKRDGYKEVFHFFNILHSSLYIPFNKYQMELIIENKDIAQLYEIWTYFKMLNIVEECIGVTPENAVIISSNDFKAYINNSIKVTYKMKGVTIKVWYNKTYIKGEGSYSLTLRPDIVIEVGDAKYIFDAKYKLEKVNWENNTENEHEEEQSFTFKNGDIYKMHTYKDAIDNVKFACILYPNPKNENIQLFIKNDEFGGVGAVPLLPGIDIFKIKDFVKKYIICLNV